MKCDWCDVEGDIDRLDGWWRCVDMDACIRRLRTRLADRDAEISRLTREVEEVKRERDEARGMIHPTHVTTMNRGGEAGTVVVAKATTPTPCKECGGSGKYEVVCPEGVKGCAVAHYEHCSCAGGK